MPEEGFSELGDLIRFNIGHKVSRIEYHDHLILAETLSSEFHELSFNFKQYFGVLSGGIAENFEQKSF